MKVSAAIITNAKRPDVLDACVTSCMLSFDEVIVVGNISSIPDSYNVKKINAINLANIGNIGEMRNIGAFEASGEYIVNCDDDMIFPHRFRNKLDRYIVANAGVEVFSTRIINSKGGRCWDRVVYKNGKSYMIEYDAEYDDDLYYTGGFIVRSSTFAKKYKWPKNLGFNQKEDVIYSDKIKSDGHKVNIDFSNYVIHYDDRYISYRNNNGLLVCDNVNLHNYENEVCDEKLHRVIDSIIRYYNNNGVVNA